MPLPEEPSRLDRQTVSTRGPVRRVVGVLGGEPQPAGPKLVDHVARWHGLAGPLGLVGKIQRVTAERRVRRHPAQPGRLGQAVRDVLPANRPRPSGLASSAGPNAS